MKQTIRTVLMLGLLPLFSFVTTIETHMLEETPVQIRLVTYGSNPESLVFLNLHENERTSVEAAKDFLESRSGTFVSVQQNGNRNIAFTLKNTAYVFDPNRMFTKTGRIRNLKMLNKNYSSAAEETVEEFSDKLISKFRQASLVVALHNNTNGKPLSVHSYRVKYVVPGMDPDDFVLTTEKSIFERLKAKRVNAVLETTGTSIDDGSLAYYCSKKNLPYINVEAQAGHQAEQLKMLKALDDIIELYAE
ncbi:MAG TPA: hypothetical protein VF145_11840 [Chitinophagaceae bacterium]